MKNKLDAIQTEDLIQELIKRGFIRVLWHKDDIEIRLNSLEYKFSDYDVACIAENIQDTFDAEIGLNWNTIDFNIDNHFGNAI